MMDDYPLPFARFGTDGIQPGKSGGIKKFGRGWTSRAGNWDGQFLSDSYEVGPADLVDQGEITCRYPKAFGNQSQAVSFFTV